MLNQSEFRDRPPLLRSAIIIAIIEAVCVVGFGIWNLIAIVLAARDVNNYAFLPMGIAFLVVTVILGAFIRWGAKGLLKGKRHGRAPVVTWQIMQIVVALSTLAVYPVALNITVVLVSLFVIYAVLHKESIAATA